MGGVFVIVFVCLFCCWFGLGFLKLYLSPAPSVSEALLSLLRLNSGCSDPHSIRSSHLEVFKHHAVSLLYNVV